VLLQLRVTVPPDRTARVREIFEHDPGTAHLAVLPGASVSPAGDLVVADVARESADGLIAALRDLRVNEDGGIAITPIDTAISSAARNAEDRAPGDASDAVVWEQVIRGTDADSALSVSYLAFMTIATLLAGVAVINDSAILTIGAMVLGPEFGPLVALAVAVVHRRPGGARRAVVTLTVGFVVAIGTTAAVTLIGRGLGWFGPELLGADRPQTGFITSPDKWSLVVAVLAGVAGVLSLTSSKSGALVGVFISVTTVPAAADMAVSLALGGGQQFTRAAIQLGIKPGRHPDRGHHDARGAAGGLAAGAGRPPADGARRPQLRRPAPHLTDGHPSGGRTTVGGRCLGDPHRRFARPYGPGGIPPGSGADRGGDHSHRAEPADGGEQRRPGAGGDRAGSGPVQRHGRPRHEPAGALLRRPGLRRTAALGEVPRLPRPRRGAADDGGRAGAPRAGRLLLALPGRHRAGDDGRGTRQRAAAEPGQALLPG